ncbi:MAG: glycosyltransferase family 2 protein [Candidatus Niyogibacteria bacterium]|nr:glycosyltransferase family 2 protein [Candidatus Niyogibacteria bacterium]
MGKSISVFLPAFNEEGCIRDIVLEADQYLKSRFKDYEILVMSHGSTDSTDPIVRELATTTPNLKLVAREKNFGYANVLRDGFRSSTKDLIFYTDGDRQFDIKEMDLLLPLLDKYDIVTGYKLKRNDPLMRIWMSWFYNLTLRWLFGLKLKDINCAFKLYKRKIIDGVDFLPDLTQGVINAEIYLSALQNGYTIGEVGVHHYYRLTGFADSEVGKRGKIIALVKLSVITGFLRDTYKLWQKTHYKKI